MKKACLSALLALILILSACAASPQPSAVDVFVSPSPTHAAAVPTPALTLLPAPAPVPTPDAAFDDAAAVHMLLINTGKSDALLFVLPDGTSFMVDTGLKDTYDAVETALSHMGVDALDAVIITHAHSDHIGGLKKLLKNHSVAAIYTNPLDTATYSQGERDKLDKYAVDYGLTLHGVSGGDSFSIGCVDIDVLSPSVPYTDEMDDNNNSLVLRVTYKNTRYLLMGDATTLIEHALLNGGVDLAADVLKVGRHGKTDASLDAFIEAVSPKYAAVTGNTADDPESPAPSVLALLSGLGVEYYTNDGWQMAVDYVSDGETVRAEVIT